ncbi:hypothetical protein [Xanthomonas maliensis]|uniref:hypothetical protein n=1 Tax=Xanthomonas maliensis TaxID=1321368 RepID=UPI00126472BD|nr:hypothetical protein [Xanthomonas maliensis]KAB7765623.1 hypothetical protein CKY51_14985 [Xanthomonas maliensis]
MGPFAGFLRPKTGEIGDECGGGQAATTAWRLVRATRKQAVEQVFGTLKTWLGTTPLLTKTLPKIRMTIRLAGLARHMRGMMEIAGCSACCVIMT